MRICLVFLFFYNFCFSQSSITDSVYVINQVEIKSDKRQFYKAANKNQNLDSSLVEFQNFSLADILIRKSPVFVKNYGQGSLATPSFRGTSANHTAVVWNGFNLQSAMNGTFDLSLVPAFLMDNVELNYGGQSALYGSGAIGGVIQLYSEPKFIDDFSVQLYGSYNSILDRMNGIKINFSNSKSHTVLKYLNQDIKNQYQFYNYSKHDSPLETQKNAAQKSNALVFENYLNLKNNQVLSFKAWYQKNDRNIPSSIFYNLGSANQKDENLRLCSEWIKYWDKTKLSVRAANLNENIVYEDSVSFLKTISNSNTSVFEADVKREIVANHYLEIGTNITYIAGKSNGYSSLNPSINKQALLLSYKALFFRKLSGLFSARQEIFNGKVVPFTFSGSLNYTILKQLELFAKGSKNYRLPTFNDLFWQPGGNINLLPEQGYCEEIGFTYEIKNNKNKLRIENTVYNKNIKNWIVWLPQSGYWSPQNVLQVWSRGYEAAINGNFGVNKTSVFFDVRYNYVLSTNQKTNSPNDASLNKQLIYVPIYNAQSTIGFTFKKFKIDYNYTYTYYRYTTSDNYYYLDPFQVSNVSASYITKQFKSCALTIAAQVNNLFNTEYEVVSGRPMPLRFYQLSLIIQFKKSNHEKS